MRQKELALALRGIVVLCLLAGAALGGLLVPALGLELVREFPEVAWLFWPCLIGFWLTCLPVLAALVLVWRLTAPTGETGAKTVTVQVVHGDGTAKDFTLETDEAYLGPALVAGGVVEDNQGPYGLYILVADGETADEGAQEWWKLTQDGEMINTSADTTPIADGDSFSLVYTVG